MSYDPYKAMYIHIPFCKQRCLYCDFVTSVESNEGIMSNYVDSLIEDIRVANKEGKLSSIETIYIGGGTPTHLGNKLLTSLIYFLSITLDFSKLKEFTIECNPESLNDPLVKDLYSLGVNRLSLGVQTFNDEFLNMIGRVHDSNKARSAIEMALARFENVSIDLMCGLPGQALLNWEEDLDTAVKFDIKHISVYPLTLERTTPLAKFIRKRKLPGIDEDLQADMMEAADNFLRDFDFARYEVSNYSKPGFESMHNLSYWTGVPYIGFGKSACAMTQNDERRMRVQDGRVLDDLNKPQMVAEDLMMKMRTVKGVSFQEVEKARQYLSRVDEVFNNLLDEGFIQTVDNSYIPTKRGWLSGNVLYGEIFDLA